MWKTSFQIGLALLCVASAIHGSALRQGTDAARFPIARIEDLGVCEEPEVSYVAPSIVGMLGDGRYAWNANNTGMEKHTRAFYGKPGAFEELKPEEGESDVEIVGVDKAGILYCTSYRGGQGYRHAFTVDHGRRSLLPLPGPEFDGSEVVSVNRSGVAVGYAMTDSRLWQYQPCLWRKGVCERLDLSDMEGTTPIAISDDGQLLYSIPFQGDLEEVYPNRWIRKPVHRVLDGKRLTDLECPDGYHASPTALSSRGLVVGFGSPRPKPGQPPEPYDVVLWRNGKYRDLGTLDGGYAYAGAVNAGGTIIGQVMRSGQTTGFGTEGKTRALLWDDKRGMRYLDTVLPPGSGGTLETAQRFDYDGAILGTGRLNGKQHFYRLTLPAGRK